MIEKAKQAELSEIIAVIENARAFLKQQGLDQWQTSAYPASTDILADIKNGVGYVLKQDGEIVGYGAVITGIEPAYEQIQGQWLTQNDAYVTVHRLAISDKYRGKALGQQFFTAVFDMFADVGDFRVDTHPDNQIMQHILTKLGFQACGIVLYESERIAFQKVTRDDSQLKNGKEK